MYKAMLKLFELYGLVSLNLSSPCKALMGFCIEHLIFH